MPTSCADAELMAAFQRGDATAFEELVERHHRGLIHFFTRLTGDRVQAEDSTQEVFLRLASHARTYEPRAKFTTYLYRIARNLWIDALRERAHRPRPVPLDGDGGEDDAPREWAVAPLPAPAEAAARGETAALVRRAIDRLPDEQRLVVLLSELQGLTYAEISDVLDIPVGTVKSRMYVAVRRLRALLASMAEESPERRER